MEQRIKILGIPIHNVTMEQAVDKLLQFLKEDGCHKVYTPNPEAVMAARKDPQLKSILTKGDLVVPDGIGIVLASRLKSAQFPERVPGYDMVQNLFMKIKDRDCTVYFFGAAPGVAKIAAENMKRKYRGLKIIGIRDGYFSENEEKSIVDEINEKQPDILLVGLGVPKQEKWITKYQDNLQVKVCIGVGGSFDGMAEKVKRAPIIFQRLGLEWFHRLLLQPTRAKRMIQLPLFVLEVLKEFFTSERKTRNEQ